MYFRFSKLSEEAKDPLLSRRRFIQRFPKICQSVLSVIIIGIIGATPIIKNVINNIKKKNCKIINTLEPIVLSVLLIVCVSYLVDGSFNPFLYFRF